jgi:hypothetical protein
MGRRWHGVGGMYIAYGRWLHWFGRACLSKYERALADMPCQDLLNCPVCNSPVRSSNNLLRMCHGLSITPGDVLPYKRWGSAHLNSLRRRRLGIHLGAGMQNWGSISK